MFTPPASPLPRPLDTPLTPSPMSSLSLSPSPSPSRSPSPTPNGLKPPIQFATPPPKRRARAETIKTEAFLESQDRKRRIARRTRFFILLVPLVLIFVALFTRYISHPIIFDLLSPSAPEPLPSWSNMIGEHEAHALARRQNSGSGQSSAGGGPIAFPSGTATTSATPSGTQSATQSVPTIPTSPPVLPTPFPQPWDTTLSQNFTSPSCQTFIANMTGTEAFRQCRPFSLLWQASNTFIQAQSNVTALNIDVWGTCNTVLSTDQCNANIGWFASALPKQCAEELADDNATVQQALQGLKTYGLMRQVACLADQSTSAYCYVEAVIDKDPSDLYFYSLPFGLSLPNKTVPTCSGCTKSVMALFGEQATQIDGLKETYDAAARIADSACGQGYVANVSTPNAASGRLREVDGVRWGAILVFATILLGLL